MISLLASHNVLPSLFPFTSSTPATGFLKALDLKVIRNEYYRLLQHVHNAQCSRVKTAEVLVKAISSVQSFRFSSQNEVLASLAFQNICVLGSSLVAPPLELKQIMEPFHFLFLMTLGYKGKERDG